MFSAMLRHVYGCVFLRNEAPSGCGNQGGGYHDGDLRMQHRLSSLRVNILPARQFLWHPFPPFMLLFVPLFSNILSY